MSEINLQLDAGLTRAEAFRDALKHPIRGELMTFDYDENSGLATVATRAFPAVEDAPTESDASKMLNASLESVIVLQENNDQFKLVLDEREKTLRRGERDLKRREKELAKDHSEFARKQKGLPPLGVIARARFVLSGDK